MDLFRTLASPVVTIFVSHCPQHQHFPFYVNHSPLFVIIYVSIKFPLRSTNLFLDSVLIFAYDQHIQHQVPKFKKCVTDFEKTFIPNVISLETTILILSQINSLSQILNGNHPFTKFLQNSNLSPAGSLNLFGKRFFQTTSRENHRAIYLRLKRSFFNN